MTRSELLSLLGSDAVVHVLEPPFTFRKGFQWVQTLPVALNGEPSDSNVFPTRSRLLLCEDNTLLGPGHSIDVDVVGIGKGAYVHWSTSMYFSTSDNTDPNVNGRCYSVVVGPDRASLVGFGSCHIEAMVRSMAGRKPVDQIYIGALTHYTSEMIQFVRLCREGIDIPSGLLPYILPKADLAILETRDVLQQAQGVFLEICNTDEITFDAYYLNRNLLGDHLLQPLQKMGEPVQSYANDWYYNGILGHKESVRAAAVEKLLPLIPTGNPDDDMRRQILIQARSRRQDETALKNGIGILREMVSQNVCVLGHILRYMPDGRPMYWPPTFMRQLSAVCRELDVPLVDPAKVVQEKGPEFSLENERYYTRQFIEEMGDRLYRVWSASLTA